VSFIRSDKCTIKIDLAALSHNFSRLDALMGAGCGRLMPVIKSDAYGHGMEWVARELKDRPVWGFGLYECREASVLRDLGYQGRIFLLSGLLNDSPEQALNLDLTVGIVNPKELQVLDKAAKESGRKLPVHLKVDTGMGRFGLSPEELIETVKNMSRWPGLEFQGLYTHMAAADLPDDPLNVKQLSIFKDVLQGVHNAGWLPKYIHMANSAALLNLPETRFNLARPGIALYGAFSSRGVQASGFRPVMSFSARICRVRSLKAGSTVSYGHTFTCRRKTVIGIVPVGYDNGYPRALSNRAHVLVNGKRCPVVGNICMRAFMVDVTGAGQVSEGQEVIIIGRSEREEINVCRLAEKAGTISYELLCLLGKLNRRIIVK